MNRKRSKCKVLPLLLWLVCILNSGYMLQVAGGTIASFIQYGTIVLGIILFYDYVVNQRTVRKATSRQMFFWVFFIFSLISTLVNIDSIVLWLNTISVVFLALYIVEKYSAESIIRVFTNTIFTIALISLMFMAWISIIGIPTSLSMVSTAATTNEYYNYVVFFYPKLWASSLGRNRGIFWEPGLFASYLNIALLLEVNYVRRPSKMKIIIYIMTIFTTLSTAGILLLIVPMITGVDKMFHGRIKIVGSMIILSGLVMALVFKNEIVNMLIEINPLVFTKLLGEEQTTVTRIGAPLLNIKIFLENPLFGRGFGGATQEFFAGQQLFRADSQTSTSLYMLAAMGGAGALYTIYWIGNVWRLRNKSILVRMGFLLLFISILNKEPHTVLLGTWVVMFLMSRIEEVNVKGGIKQE